MKTWMPADGRARPDTTGPCLARGRAPDCRRAPVTRRLHLTAPRYRRYSLPGIGRLGMAARVSRPGSARRLSRTRGALLAVLTVALPGVALAQSDFYSGKRITVAVGMTAGGGYDLYARAVAPFLAEHTPGKPTVVV